MQKRTWLIAPVLIGVLAESISVGLCRPARAEAPYSPGGWSTLHQGPDNRKLVPRAPIEGPYRRWTALAGASVLTAPTLSPDGRTLYVTTGKAVGHSNLHAFDLEGQILWQSEPWQSAERGVDPCAILSSPIVDREGDVYIGDCNQLFAYRPGGELKWVVPLPAPEEGDWRASRCFRSTRSRPPFSPELVTSPGSRISATSWSSIARPADGVIAPCDFPGGSRRRPRWRSLRRCLATA